MNVEMKLWKVALQDQELMMTHKENGDSTHFQMYMGLDNDEYQKNSISQSAHIIIVAVNWLM